MEEAASHFHYLLTAFDPAERQVVDQVARGLDPSAEYAAPLKSLEADGYVERDGAMPRLFSRAFARFLQEAATAPEGGPVAAPAGRTPRRRPLYAGAVLLGLLALLFYALYPFQSTIDLPSPETGPAIEAPRPASLAIALLGRRMRGGQVAGEDKFSAPTTVDLGPGDQYRLEFSVPDSGYLYLFRSRFGGDLLLLSATSGSTPLALKGKERYQLPAALGEWFTVEDREDLHFVLSPQRDRELEELYQRFLQAAHEKKKEYRRRLLETISRQSLSRIEIAAK